MAEVASKYLIPQFVLAHFSHHVATGVLIPILPLLRESFGLNYFQSGVLVSAFSISYGIGQIPMAMLADRFSPRAIILVGLVGISFTGIGVSLSQSFLQMAVCFVAMGLIGGTYHAPASSFISQQLPSERRGRALGFHVTGGTASFSLTPLMALGIASLFHSWRSAFFILAIPAFLVGVILWLTTRQVPRKGHSGGRGRTAQERSPGGGTALRVENGSPQTWWNIIRALGIIVCLTMGLQIVFSSVGSYLPLYMVDHHGISPKWAGMVISVISVASLVGAPLGGTLSDRIGRKQVIIFAFCLSGPFFFAVTRSPFGIPLLLSLLCYGMAMSFRMATMESLIADVVPVGRRATVLGIYFFLGMETAGITTPIVGRFIDHFGLDPVFNNLALGLCGMAVLALFLRKRL
jgi:FSR family fosmidomycin resistance protein-like MFS transporter